jgi:L-lactate dehydrogenase (cytochrome)
LRGRILDLDNTHDEYIDNSDYTEYSLILNNTKSILSTAIMSDLAAMESETPNIPAPRGMSHSLKLNSSNKPDIQLPSNVPSLDQILSANDFALAAQKALTPKAWAFYSSAATDLVTWTRNRELIRRVMLRPRILRNVSEVKINRKILGLDSKAPFIMCPAAMATLAHPDGELGWSRAAASEGIFEIVSFTVDIWYMSC